MNNNTAGDKEAPKREIPSYRDDDKATQSLREGARTIVPPTSSKRKCFLSPWVGKQNI